ncbi:MAG: hypothetical protein ABEI99_07055 [Halobaculum sp.]
MEYPTPNEEELPQLYDDLRERLDTTETVLRDFFPIETAGQHERVVLSSVSETTYLDAMWEEPAVMVELFQNVTGLSDCEFERLSGHANIGGLKERKTNFTDEEKAEAFASAVREQLPESMYLETLLFTYQTVWQADHRRHYRRQYEETVRETLRDAGFGVVKDESFPGKPDFVVPTESPFLAVGEVRVVVPRDYDKRFKEFGSEARKASESFPDAKFVAVANVPAYELDERRTELRAMIHDLAEAEIDAVVFQDEIDDLTTQLERWKGE